MKMWGDIGIWVTLGVPVVCLLLWWWNEVWYAIPQKIKCSAARTTLPPGHMGFPILGELPALLWYFTFLGRPEEFIDRKRRKYGDGVGMYRSYLFGSPAIITCNPSSNKFVIQSSEELFKLGWPNPALTGTSSLVEVEGEGHARLKTCVTNAINTPHSLGRANQLLQPLIVAALRSWTNTPTITTYHQLKKLTFENIGKLFLSLEAGPLLDTIDRLCGVIYEGTKHQPSKLYGTPNYRASQCRKKLDVILKGELEKKKKNKIVNLNGGNDVMDGLMQMKDKEGNNLSDKEVIDNLVTLIIGAYVSTAYSGMWAIYSLAKSPNVLHKLREENMAIKENKDCEFLTSEDLSKMTYTKKVVDESIRMANVVGMIIRSTTKDIDYKGYIIPKGWKVIVWLRYLHTNPENFEDPMCFNPDRWDKPKDPGAFQAFGGGVRICPGNMLARLQLSVLLHHLCVGYKWELINPNAKIAYIPHPGPVDGVQAAFTKL